VIFFRFKRCGVECSESEVLNYRMQTELACTPFLK